jgi:hypothetical protein
MTLNMILLYRESLWILFCRPSQLSALFGFRVITQMRKGFSNKLLLSRAFFIIHSTISWLVLYIELPLYTGKGKRRVSAIYEIHQNGLHALI